MNNLFALFPLFSIYLLYHAARAKFNVHSAAVLFFVAGSLLLGYFANLIVPGMLYAALFALVGFFPVILRREVKGATEQYRTSEKILKEQVDQSKFEREKWTGIRQRVG